MADHDSQHDSPSDVPASEPPAWDDSSTVAAPHPASLAPPNEGTPRSSENSPAPGGSSVVRDKAADLPAGSTSPLAGTSSTAPAPTDKTVISKRSSLETPLLILPTPQTLGQALVGKTLDHYELVEFVGGGGMGAVFRSNDTRLGRTVAVKVLSRDHTDEETIKRFRNEAQSAARLDHPNIARVYFVGEAEGWNYIVFEYIEGTNLRDIVDSRGPLPLEVALNYTLQVAEAIDHASKRDVVHRDIKPSNVLVTPGGQVKLVDMGLARLHQVESTSEDLTASGVMLGTFDYISPEQARDPRSADVRSDIYSLGCTLYFMLAGRPPFPEGTAVQKLLKHNSEEPPDLRLFRPELPQPASALVSRMLAKRPSQRQQTPQDLIAEVLSLAQQLGLSGLARQATVLVAASPPASSFWSRALPIAVPIAGLVLLLWLVEGLSRQREQPLNVVVRPRLKPAVTSPQAEDASQGTKTPADVVTSIGNRGGLEKTDTAPNNNVGEKSPAPPNGAAVPAIPATVSGNDDPPDGKQTDIPMLDPGGADSQLPPIGRSGSDEGVIGSAAPTGASSEKPKIKRVVVRKDPQDTTVPEGAKVVNSLARACQEAALYGVSEIELQFSGPLAAEEQPFDVTQTRAHIYAGEDPNHAGQRYRPVIVFRPQVGTERERQMIRLVGGSTSSVEVQGVELRLELPADPSSRWALLALYRMQRLVLTDCVLTVVDAAGSGKTPVQDRVAMLALQPRITAETMKMMDDANAMIPSMDVRLLRCVARGEATFFIARDESPLKISWSQGLLVTNQRMFQSEGTSIVKPSDTDLLKIDLNYVTAVTPHGLVHQKPKPSAAHFGFEVQCQNCVLLTDAGVPLFEFEDLPGREDINLVYEGRNNVYPQRTDSLFLRLRQSTTLQEIKRSNNELSEWGRDLGSDSVLWAQDDPPSVTELPAHKHAPSMYLLDPEKFGMDDNPRGFAPNLLPLPFEAVIQPTTEANFFE